MNFRALALMLPLVLCAAAVEDPGQLAEHLREKHRQETIAAARTWLAKADLEPVSEPSVSADPRESEKAAAAEVRDLNLTLEEWRTLRDGKQDDALYAWFQSVKAKHGAVKRYMKFKGRAAAK